MDDGDYSWVRRTRFSQSIVRSSSGGDGAFIEQFSRGAELRQNGLGTGYKHPRQTLQPPLAKGPGGVSNSARLPIPKAKSAVAQLERKLKHASSDGQLNRDRSGDRSSQESSAKQDRKGVVSLNLDIPQRHVVRPSKESPDALDFSLHSDEHSQRLQRVCSSPAPFFMKDATATADSCHSLFQLG